MSNLIKFIAIVCFCSAIAFNTPAAIADTAGDSSNSLKQAAQKVIEDDGAKEQFGKSDSGEQLLDSAKTEASKKLTKLADESDSTADLPESKKLFLENLKAE